MQHPVRTAVTAAVAAAIGFGITAPVATAAPKSGHVKVAKAKPGKAHGHATATAAFVRNVLRQAEHIQSQVDANALLVGDNAEAAAANQVAAEAVAAAVEKANGITVDSTKAVRADLHTARVALEAVEEALAAAVVEPVVTEPVVTEPVVDPAL